MVLWRAAVESNNPPNVDLNPQPPAAQRKRIPAFDICIFAHGTLNYEVAVGSCNSPFDSANLLIPDARVEPSRESQDLTPIS